MTAATAFGLAVAGGFVGGLCAIVALVVLALLLVRPLDGDLVDWPQDTGFGKDAS